MLRLKLNTCFTIYRTYTSNLNKKMSRTIFAHCSGQGKCGVAVIRISGNYAGNAMMKITNFKELPKSRYALLKNIKNPENNEIIDKGLVLWFPAPNSFTGEDCCELHVHGSLAVITAILNMLGTLNNLRLAEPGEFTKRAFSNGKLDLTEVEGLADLLQAETEIQRKQAFLQSQGSLNKLYNKWSKILQKNLAYFEGYIDFDETDTLDENLLTQVHNNVNKLINQINLHLQDGCKGERLRNGVKTIILGNTNVGKSSLLNALCQRPAAIVTPIEGTTRDILEVMMDIGGYPLLLADTAGLRKNVNDIVEQEGINRALNLYKEADLILLVMDSSNYTIYKRNNPTKNIEDYLKDYIVQLGLSDLLNNDNTLKKRCILIMNKVDLVDNSVSDKFVCISCKTQHGFQTLLTKIEENLRILCGEPNAEHPCMNQARHKQNLIKCAENLEKFLNEEILDTAIHAEYLRKSLHYLGALIGKVTTEQILNVIFKDFCIGK